MLKWSSSPSPHLYFPLGFCTTFFQASSSLGDHSLGKKKHHLVCLTAVFAPGRQRLISVDFWGPQQLSDLWATGTFPRALANNFTSITLKQQQFQTLGCTKCQENIDMWREELTVFSVSANPIHRMPTRQMQFFLLQIIPPTNAKCLHMGGI